MTSIHCMQVDHSSIVNAFLDSEADYNVAALVRMSDEVRRVGGEANIVVFCAMINITFPLGFDKQIVKYRYLVGEHILGIGYKKVFNHSNANIERPMVPQKGRES